MSQFDLYLANFFIPLSYETNILLHIGLRIKGHLIPSTNESLLVMTLAG